MTNNSDQIMLVKELGKIVKDQGLLRSLYLLNVGPCQARRRGGDFGNEQVAEPSASSKGIGCNFTDPKCRRWLFETKRLVNQREIDVGLALGMESVKRGVNAL